MKTVLNLLLIVGFISSSLTISNRAFADNLSQSLSIEASTLLLSEAYAKVIKQRVKMAKQSGQTLRILSLSTSDLGSSKFVYILLEKKNSADLNGLWNPAGTIVGSLQMGPMGELFVDGVYYKPQEEGPGGASVGNN